MNEEHVRNPDLLHQPAVEGHALVVGAREGQTFILPVMSQIQSHGKVLRHENLKSLETYTENSLLLFFKIFKQTSLETKTIEYKIQFLNYSFIHLTPGDPE